MPIKSKQANLIYHGCLLCQAIDEFEASLSASKEHASLMNDSHFKRLLVFKEHWIDALNLINEK